MLNNYLLSTETIAVGTHAGGNVSTERVISKKKALLVTIIEIVDIGIVTIGIKINK